MEHQVNNSSHSDVKDDGNLLLVKVIAMLILGLTSFLIGVLPIKLTKLFNIKSIDGDKNLLISLLLCFGGGVLLFTTFLHLQPEVRESFTILENRNKLPTLNNIPISEIVFCFGFFFVYFIEELVHLCLHNRNIIEDDGDALHRSLSIRCNKKHGKLTIPRVTLNKFDDISNISNSNKNLLSTQINFIDTITTSSTSSTTTNHSQHQQQQQQQHNHHHHHHIDNELIKHSFSGLLVVLALSFHAVFEGLAVGLETSTRNVWYLFAAIATHKLVIAFCVGVELVQSKTKLLLIFLYIGTFALVTPLGVGIGLLLSEANMNDDDDLVSPILQGMAAGTLLYVVFFEVLAREKINQHSGMWQLMAIIVGFVVMFSLQILTGHEHGHHDHHHDHHYHNHQHHDDFNRSVSAL